MTKPSSKMVLLSDVMDIHHPGFGSQCSHAIVEFFETHEDESTICTICIVRHYISSQLPYSEHTEALKIRKMSRILSYNTASSCSHIDT